MSKNIRIIIIAGVFICLGIILTTIWMTLDYEIKASESGEPSFDSQRAFNDVKIQLSYGPRTVGSDAHSEVLHYIQTQLDEFKWNVEVQEFYKENLTVQNVVAKRGEGSPWIILGAHYDSRLWADQDPDPSKRQLPVPGANDGASGVAVLLEIGRVIPSRLDRQVWLVFFDAEDNGGVMNWDWIMGSRNFVANLEGKPDAVVIVDMIGDADLHIYMEKSSNQLLKEDIWEQAAILGYQQFIPKVNYSVLDDHTPFLQAGITAVDIIDFDFPYWHTTNDTLDKISQESLDAVGETVLAWLMKYGK